MKNFKKKLEFFLRSTGRLTPITPEQVKAFESNHEIKHAENLPTPDEILKRGYQPYKKSFICKGCQCEVPNDYKLKTDGYCSLCDPNVTLNELLS